METDETRFGEIPARMLQGPTVWVQHLPTDRARSLLGVKRSFNGCHPERIQRHVLIEEREDVVRLFGRKKRLQRSIRAARETKILGLHEDFERALPRREEWLKVP